MRFIAFKNLPKTIIYSSLVVLLLITLAVSNNLNQNGPSESGASIQGEQSREADIASETSDEPGNTDEESETSSSSKTKVKISVHTNTTNNKTTGSANIEVTENGVTESINKTIEDISSGNLSIKINGEELNIDETDEDGKLEVDFDSDFDQDQESETETDVSVKERTKQRN
jgi:hypothetical protein